MEKGSNILEIKDIHCYYGASHVIQGLSLAVRTGEAVSILGRNGVGKTSTLRSLMGLNPPRRGTIHIKGQDTTGWPSHQISRLGVAYVPAERHIFPGLTVAENLRLAARPAKGADAWTNERIYELFPVLARRAHQDGSTLSGGEQQMLAIARALISNPDIIVMDEPSQGLAPLLVEMITDILINSCVNSDITLLIVEQNYHMALKVANRHYLMGLKGQIAGVATTGELIANPDVIYRHLSV